MAQKGEEDKMNIRPIKREDLAQVAEFEKEISVISFGGEAVTVLEFHQRKLEKAIPREGKACSFWSWKARWPAGYG
ncbi:hypothetical protein NLX71_12390 [Paenibacillus sp. MZ04-78.2]|uniref:hypothetical protein n=1 Tax=Paenibacillus sp. MZ04-78.2 TaxID=2962034 RepID=UPI0020B8BC75|nr:hypothetical protein [Paenibacillus sp. MZ04-78.2]MCP3774102.1 hypothetical protein [Paenibacillus sp. MZ04-78.2]